LASFLSAQPTLTKRPQRFETMLETGYIRLRGLFYRLFQNELIRRLVKNSAYLFSATGISAALSMLQSILAARMLGVAGFGILGIITMFTSVINKFASFRMGELVIKYVGAYTENGDQLKASAVFKAAALAEMSASIVAYGLIWLLAPLGARYFAKDTSLATWFTLYGLIVLANLIAESSTGLLQIFDRFRQIAAMNIVQNIITLLLTALAMITGGGMREVLLAYLIGKAISALGITYFALAEATHRWGKGWWRSPLRALSAKARELTHFAISTNISASLSLINKDSELLWVSLFRSPIEAGYYKLALSLVNLVQMPVSPLPQTTYPELSREMARKNWGNFRYILRQGSWMAGSYTLAVTIALFLLGQPLISLLFKPAFLPAYPALMIMLVGFLVANTFYWNRIALLALGKPDFSTMVNLVLAIIKVIGIILLVPVYGYLANAALLAGSYAIGVSLSVWRVYTLLPRGKPAPTGEAAGHTTR
jgi:O-antigen/teichoic acid export membrane protein